MIHRRFFCQSGRFSLGTMVWMGAVTGLLACGPWLPEQILIGRRVVLRTPVGDFAQEVRALEGPGDAAPALPPGLAREAAPTKVKHAEDEEKSPSEQIKVELAELEETLTHKRVDEPRRVALRKIYEDYRRAHGVDAGQNSDATVAEVLPFDQQADKARRAATDPPGTSPTPSPTAASPAANDPPKLPADLIAILPAEWVDYLQGADCFNAGDLAGAQKAWERLLARPQAERLYRSTWAAFMLARMQEVGAPPAESAARYQRVRELRAAGCRDGVNLAAASLGWEARLALNAKDYAAAARLYYQQGVAGPVDGDSLRTVAAAALGKGTADDPVMIASAHDPFLRRVVTLYVACHRHFGDPEEADSANADPAQSIDAVWLDTLTKAGVDAVHEAPAVAWAAYYHGDYATAARWLKLAPADHPLALWLRAKLALRDGKNEEAARGFAQAVHAYPAEPDIDNNVDWASTLADDGRDFRARQFQMDLGVIQLSRGDFQQALTSLLRSGFWRDAAYVAERVLTVKELEQYVHDHYPQAPGARERAATKHDAEEAGDSDDAEPVTTESKLVAATKPGDTTDPVAFSLRYLLARRLARGGRYAEARPFYPGPLLPKYDEYVAARKLGESGAGAGKGKRAEALWRTAKIERYLGMELFGTEAGPDWHVEGGSFQDDDYPSTRAGDSAREEGRANPGSTTEPVVPFVPPVGAGEKQRVAKEEVQPPERYHYRYTAAELAWKAAALMPDQQEETAKVLATGGHWLESVDAAKAADRFYLALLRRCGKTDLGRAAEKKGSVPEVPREEP